MLLTKLKSGDRIKIGEATIEVKKATGDNLRLAIGAPRELPIQHLNRANEVQGLSPEQKLEQAIEPSK